VTLRRVQIDLSVEREVEDAAGTRRRIRLVGRYATEPDGAAPSAEELVAAVAALQTELDTAVGAPAPVVREDRPILELVETYRPRQRELVDLLLDEKELTPGEALTMREYLAQQVQPVPDPAGVPVTDRPIAAAPLANDRSPSSARPVPDLLRLYRIESLKQAGAVRARRQISYEEYMSLKRHFPPAEVAPTSTSSPPE
jgi:hypothetical protein